MLLSTRLASVLVFLSFGMPRKIPAPHPFTNPRLRLQEVLDYR